MNRYTISIDIEREVPVDKDLLAQVAQNVAEVCERVDPQFAYGAVADLDRTSLHSPSGLQSERLAIRVVY